MELIFCTHNENKVKEVQAMIDPCIGLISLKDLGLDADIEENGHTFAENAQIKSQFVYRQFRRHCLADDSGLEVEALNREPGIYSARYSGSRDMQKNCDLVLEKLQGKLNRKACFVCVLCLVWEGSEHFFEGRTEGIILEKASGKQGFGYDPIFQPLGYEISFADMSPSLKNEISHRGRAIKQVNDFLMERNFNL